LETIWEIFDLSLLFSQTGIRKHSGIATWLMAFSYICGLVANVGSVNQNAAFIGESPVLQQILSRNMITQSAFSRFLSKPFNWLKFSLGRLSRLQERTETRLTDGDIIALDDTKIEHPHGKKLPFLCWLFDSSDKPGYLLREVYPKLRILGRGRILNIPDIYIKLPYEDITRKGKPITRHRFTPIAAIAATYSKQADDAKVVLPEEEAAATFRDAYLLISNRVDAPEEVANAYVKRWRIEVFYRAVKQDLGLTSCYAQSDTAHFAHVELLFTQKPFFATPCGS